MCDRTPVIHLRLSVEIFGRGSRPVDVAEGEPVWKIVRSLELPVDGTIILDNDSPIPEDTPVAPDMKLTLIGVVSGG